MVIVECFAGFLQHSFDVALDCLGSTPDVVMSPWRAEMENQSPTFLSSWKALTRE